MQNFTERQVIKREREKGRGQKPTDIALEPQCVCHGLTKAKEVSPKAKEVSPKQ
jgi:hypothetical protein